MDLENGIWLPGALRLYILEMVIIMFLLIMVQSTICKDLL
jgi:hypothetical protein